MPNTGYYLDIGCGTGNYTIELHKKGLQMIAVDPSIEMLAKAKAKNNKIDWQLGSAENLDLPNHSIDGVIATLTLHHWKDIKAGFRELHRVLKPGGKMVLFTSTPNQMKKYWLNDYFPKMLEESIRQMPSKENTLTAISESGIKIIKTDRYFVRPDLEDHFLYCGKQNPELYFNPQVRNGISSFSDLALQQEVERGLLKLRQDIDSGKINEVISSYNNDSGDYLFIVGEKSPKNKHLAV